VIVQNDSIGVSYDTDDIEDEDQAVEPIGDMAAAERAMSAVRYFTQRQAEVQATHKAEQERIDAWAAEEDRKLEERKKWHVLALQGWHRAVVADDETRKTINLPSGKLKRLAGSESLEVLDEEAFLAVAPDELVQVKKSVKKTETRLHIKATGEVLPGVRVVPAEPLFEVKPS
jgi:ABC-type hemin transport system substrate-binding protein